MHARARYLWEEQARLLCDFRAAYCGIYFSFRFTQSLLIQSIQELVFNYSVMHAKFIYIQSYICCTYTRQLIDCGLQIYFTYLALQLNSVEWCTLVVHTRWMPSCGTPLSDPRWSIYQLQVSHCRSLAFPEKGWGRTTFSFVCWVWCERSLLMEGHTCHTRTPLYNLFFLHFFSFFSL